MPHIYVAATLACLDNLRQQLLALEHHLELPANERAANIERVCQSVHALHRELNEMFLDASAPATLQVPTQPLKSFPESLE